MKWMLIGFNSRLMGLFSERGLIHEESSNVIHQIIRTCEEKMAEIEGALDEEEGAKI